jgi:hypothetical protein
MVPPVEKRYALCYRSAHKDGAPMVSLRWKQALARRCRLPFVLPSQYAAIGRFAAMEGAKML